MAQAEVIQGLLQRGVPPHIAAGIAGNIAVESRFDPGINEISPLVPGSRGGFGLFQHTGPRRRALEAFAQQRGVPVNDLNTQLDFALQELQTTEKAAGEALFKAQTPEEAARVFSEKFLRPGIPHLDRRISAARSIFGGGGDAGLLGGETTPQGGRDNMANGLGGLLGGGRQSGQPGGIRAEGGLLGEGGLLSPDRRDRLILALQGMTLNPNQGLQQAALQGIQGRQQQRQTREQANRTAEFLRQRGRDDLAGAVESGAVPAQVAVQEALRPAAAPETRVVEGRLVNAQTGDVIADFSSSGNVTQITGRDLIEKHGVDPTQIDPNSLFNVAPDGRVTQISGGGIEVNVGGERETAFQKEVGKVLGQQATSIIEQGSAASRNLVELRALESTLEAAPQGATGQITSLAGRLGLPVEGVSDVQAAEAIISRLVPQQRPPGSGTMSDADLALFRQSLPQIANQPGGNKRIIETMRNIAEYDVKRAQIAQRLISGEISQDQAFSEYAKLSNPLGWVREGFKPSQGGGDPQSQGQTQQQGRATHRFNPETGQIEVIR
jgi:hypothetical protein